MLKPWWNRNTLAEPGINMADTTFLFKHSTFMLLAVLNATQQNSKWYQIYLRYTKIYSICLGSWTIAKGHVVECENARPPWNVLNWSKLPALPLTRFNTTTTRFYQHSTCSKGSWLAATPAALGSPSPGSKFFNAAISWSWAYFFLSSWRICTKRNDIPKFTQKHASGTATSWNYCQ